MARYGGRSRGAHSDAVDHAMRSCAHIDAVTLTNLVDIGRGDINPGLVVRIANNGPYPATQDARSGPTPVSTTGGRPVTLDSLP